MGKSDKTPETKAVTVRLPVRLLRKLMRARKARTQSELIHGLLYAEQERLEAEAVLRATGGRAHASDFDDRLL
jgi:transcriptional regulator of met regulon